MEGLERTLQSGGMRALEEQSIRTEEITGTGWVDSFYEMATSISNDVLMDMSQRTTQTVIENYIRVRAQNNTESRVIERVLSVEDLPEKVVRVEQAVSNSIDSELGRITS